VSNFKKMLAGTLSQEVLSPLLRSYLFDPNFPAVEFAIPSWVNRPPDGWFHPSTHTTWPERMLQFYLTHPNELVAEPFDPASVMAIVQGNLWHEFIQACLMDMKVLTGVEVKIEDRKTMARGSMDGVTNAATLPIANDEVFEFKTTNPMRLNKLGKGLPNSMEVVDSFKDNFFQYYLQGQEYMRISGYRRWRGLFLGLVYPFPMREVVMDYDEAVGSMLRDRYLRVLDAVKGGRLLEPCCAPRSKEAKVCPAREVCPVGML
jgi:hypothetical protein